MKRRHKRDYSMILYSDLPKVQEPGERIRIKSKIPIDYRVFKKSPEEKELLKLAKLQAKQEKLTHKN